MNEKNKISGKVLPGRRLGRTLGFPTANISLKNSGIPGGVYAVRTAVDGKTFGGVANAGTRPTVSDEAERFLEVHLFDFVGDLYGKTIEVELVARLRDERKFASVEALREQIEKDKINAQNFLAHN